MPLQGRKITLSMKDGMLVREGADGLEEKLLRKLDLADRTSHFFPKTPVSPGDTWEVEGDDVRKFLTADNDLKDAKVKAKFVEIRDVDGKRCAVLNTAMDLAGKGKGDVNLTIKLDAEVIVWIERGYTLSVKGKGTLTMNAENAQFKMAGQGPMTLEILNKIE